MFRTALKVTDVRLKLHHPKGGLVRWTKFSFFLSSSWVKMRLHTENKLPRLPVSALKVPVGGVGGFLPIINSSSNSCWGWVGLWQLSTLYKCELVWKCSDYIFLGPEVEIHTMFQIIPWNDDFDLRDPKMLFLSIIRHDPLHTNLKITTTLFYMWNMNMKS